MSVGLFDENNFMYGEEDDIHFRLLKTFGPAMKYNSQLHYIHPMHTREPNIEYEKMLIDSAIILNEKNGYPRRYTVLNRLRNLRLLLLRESIKKLLGRGDENRKRMMLEKRQYLKQLLGQS